MSARAVIVAPSTTALRYASPLDRSPRIIGERPSNALIKDAKAGPGLTLSETVVVSVAGKLIGGLWVGGTTYLTENAVTFQPNELNISLHEGDCSVSVALRDVTGIRQRFGFISQIIDVRTTNKVLTFRCFGARSFVEMIKAQVARSRRVLPLAPSGASRPVESANIGSNRPRDSSHANQQIARYNSPRSEAPRRFDLVRNVLSPVIAGLTLTGCVSAAQRPAAYHPAYPPTYGYSASAVPPRVIVIPRQPYHPPVMAQPYTHQTYRPQPAAVEKPAATDPPAKAEPPALRAVEPVGQYRFDNSCVGAWRICHFF